MKRPDITAIMARHKAARSGAWAHWDLRVYPQTTESHPDGPGEPDTTCREICDTSGSRNPQANAEFIAHAKTDVAELVQYIEELERKLGNENGVINPQLVGRKLDKARLLVRWKRLLDDKIAIKMKMESPEVQLWAVAEPKEGEWVMTGETLTAAEVAKRSLR